jgi:hypothetical protein
MTIRYPSVTTGTTQADTKKLKVEEESEKMIATKGILVVLD